MVFHHSDDRDKSLDCRYATDSKFPLPQFACGDSVGGLSVVAPCLHSLYSRHHNRALSPSLASYALSLSGMSCHWHLCGSDMGKSLVGRVLELGPQVVVGIGVDDGLCRGTSRSQHSLASQCPPLSSLHRPVLPCAPHDLFWS